MLTIDTRENADEGVSPVIGVILMVALTVILSAVVGTYVLNFTEVLEDPVKAGVDINEQYNENTGDYEITFTVTSTNNADRVTIKKGTSETSPMTEVGDSVTVVASQGDQLTVIASSDGTSQVQRIYIVGDS